MKTLLIKEALGRGWALFKGHKAVLVAALIALMILQIVSGNSKQGGRHFGHTSFITMLIVVIAWIAVTIVKIGWLKLVLLIEDGENPKWTEIFAYADYFIKFVVASFLYALGTGVFMILLIVPGIYFALKYAFVPYLVIDTDLSIGQSFTRSAEMTNGHKWKLLGLLLASLGIIILGALVFVVGLLVAVPVAALAYAHVYRTLSKHPGKESPSEAAEMAL